MPGPLLGLRTLLGSGVEASYGDNAAVIDRRHGFLTEGLEFNHQVIASATITGGTHPVKRGSTREENTRGGAGAMSLEFPRSGAGRFLRAALGGASTIAQVDVSAAYRQVHPIGSDVHSLLLQKVLRDGAGAKIGALTYPGCVVASWDLAINAQQYLQATFNFDARDEEDDAASTTLEGLAEPVPIPFTFKQGSVLMSDAGGSPSPVARVTAFDMSVDNMLDLETYFLGGSGLKDEPYVNDFKNVTGNVGYQITDLATFYDRFRQDAATHIQLSFVGPEIEPGYNFELFVNIPDIRFTGGAPTIGGPSTVTPSAPFEAAYDGATSPLTVEYQSDDTDF